MNGAPGKDHQAHLQQLRTSVDDPKTDSGTKLAMAAMIVRMGGDENGDYWRLLEDGAKAMLALGMPTPFFSTDDPDAESRKREFLAWIEENDLSWKEASDLATHSIQAIGAVAATRDPRAFDLLIEALGSRNDNLLLPALIGLADLGDERAVPFIIHRAESLEGSVRELTASYLLYFEDERAQAVARAMVENERLYQEMKDKVLASREDREQR